MQRRSSSSFARSLRFTKGRSRTRKKRSSATSRRSSFSLSDERTPIDVERSAKATGAWERVITSYQHAIERADGEGEVATGIMLRLRLGRVLVDEAQRVDDALFVYRAVYEADGENGEALSALERLYRQTSRFSDLLEIYERKRDLTNDAAERNAIRFEIAKLFETEIKDLDRAIATYDSILEDEPRDARALAALDVLYGRLERWEPYVDVLRRRIELDVGENELIDLKYRLGQTLEKHRGDPAGALENYREILFIDSANAGAREALEAMMLSSELRAEAASILSGIHEERADWPKLIGALEILAASEADVTERVRLRRKVASVASEQLKDFSRAFSAIAIALKDDPALVETRDEIEKIAEASQSWRELVALYDEIAEGLSDAALSRDYWMRLAAIDERLGEIDAAAKSYYRVLALDAGNDEALAALEQLFSRTRRWSDLIAVQQRRIDQTGDAAAREALYIHIAEIHDQQLSQPDEAVAAYRKVLEVDPSSQRALSALDQLFSRQKMWGELAENLDAQLALAQSDEAQVGFMLRLAALRETELAQVDAAIEGYRAVLERDATNATALAALERLGREPAYEVTIADLLEPLYRQLGDYQKLIGAHEVQVRRSEDPSRRVELLHQIAQLHEEAAGDQNAAFATYARALKEEPANETTQLALDRVARATGRFVDLAQVFQELGAETTDPTLASALYSMSARVHENDLANIDVGIAHYRKVLEIDPINLAAAESLEAPFPYDRAVKICFDHPSAEGGDLRRAGREE